MSLVGGFSGSLKKYLVIVLRFDWELAALPLELLESGADDSLGDFDEGLSVFSPGEDLLNILDELLAESSVSTWSHGATDVLTGHTSDFIDDTELLAAVQLGVNEGEGSNLGETSWEGSLELLKAVQWKVTGWDVRELAGVNLALISKDVGKLLLGISWVECLVGDWDATPG